MIYSSLQRTMRESVIADCARKILDLQRSRSGIQIVGIDGVDCSGKSTFALELAEELRKSDRKVLVSSIDGFHRPSEMRYARGEFSAEGYYHDSFDYDKLKKTLLEPLKSGNIPLTVQTRSFDFRANQAVDDQFETVDSLEAILIFEGVFLFRPEILDFWDFKIFLHVDFEVSFKRGMVRDLDLFGERSAVEEKYSRRYIPGQKLYLSEVNPSKKADLVIDNNDPLRPSVGFPA